MVYVYDPKDGDWLVRNLSQGELMPGAQRLTVSMFRGRSESETLWSDLRAIAAADAPACPHCAAGRALRLPAGRQRGGTRGNRLIMLAWRSTSAATSHPGNSSRSHGQRCTARVWTLWSLSSPHPDGCIPKKRILPAAGPCNGYPRLSKGHARRSRVCPAGCAAATGLFLRRAYRLLLGSHPGGSLSLSARYGLTRHRGNGRADLAAADGKIALPRAEKNLRTSATGYLCGGLIYGGFIAYPSFGLCIQVNRALSGYLKFHSLNVHWPVQQRLKTGAVKRTFTACIIGNFPVSVRVFHIPFTQ